MRWPEVAEPGDLCEIWLDGALDPFGPDVRRADESYVGTALWDELISSNRMRVDENRDCELMIAFDTAEGRGWGIFSCFGIPHGQRGLDKKPLFPKLK